ncbi:unnamed protein product [Ambrosiozyma monospora]|uniref:Unnamed protein product n=1 Tax=Ambrosiozyma monospora TaxID=43982 RepID=A0ACB5T0I9_AMBMO|nr:unnamed protein product [Ambrosiozyma monospora]
MSTTRSRNRGRGRRFKGGGGNGIGNRQGGYDNYRRPRDPSKIQPPPTFIAEEDEYGLVDDGSWKNDVGGSNSNNENNNKWERDTDNTRENRRNTRNQNRNNNNNYGNRDDYGYDYVDNNYGYGGGYNDDGYEYDGAGGDDGYGNGYGQDNNYYGQDDNYYDGDNYNHFNGRQNSYRRYGKGYDEDESYESSSYSKRSGSKKSYGDGNGNNGYGHARGRSGNSSFRNSPHSSSFSTRNNSPGRNKKGKSREAPLQPPPSYVEEVYGDYDEDTCGGIGTSVNSLPLGKKRDIFKNRNLDTSGYSNDVKVGDGEVVYYENEEEAKLGEMGG